MQGTGSGAQTAVHSELVGLRCMLSVAFDPSFTGESGGEPRHVASPDINTEDLSAAVDFLGLQPNVDRNRIGAIDICGFSGMALTAHISDLRIRAGPPRCPCMTLSCSISRSYNDGYTMEQRHKVIDHISQQRWADAESSQCALGYHEDPSMGKAKSRKESECSPRPCRQP